MMPPDLFIPVAEERGLIEELGHWVFEEACRTLQSTDLPWLAVNVSPVELRNARFFNRVLTKLQSSGIDPRRLQLEITEGVLYRARLMIPARVPVGRFTAETFLIRDGRVLAAATRDIEIRKSGFERFVARAADRHAVVYGLVAVALSMLFGWAAGQIARRF